MHFLTKYVVTFTFLYIINDVKCCEFDSIVDQRLNVPKLALNYGSSRNKRDTNHYRPLRFHVEVEESGGKYAEKVKKIVLEATSQVSRLLHVIPVQGSLLLERTACSSTWSTGENKGRCSSLRSKPKEEFCENKIDNFQIPEQHLQRLDIYNFSGQNPVYSLPAGEGVKYADYFLYTKNKFTPMCQNEDVQAYASYCRLDQFNRPVAGFINFCPSGLNKKSFDRQHFLNIAVHEILHAVGFSKDLFSEYAGCPIGSTDCSNRKSVITSDRHGIPRLNFPSVSSLMQTHFSCSENDFGGPLQSVNGSFTSHWDPLILFGSIMTPTLDDPEFTVIDPITLSVLADSGWYSINYEAAASYLWGKGEGCNFGFQADCQSKQNGLCDFRTASSGCDFMHYTQTDCVQLSPLHACGIYKPNMENDCRSKIIEVNGQHLHHLRCFAVQQFGKIGTTCAAYQCKQPNNVVGVLLHEAWVACTGNETVNLRGTTVFCPKGNNFCAGHDHRSNTFEHLSSVTVTLRISNFVLFSPLVFLAFLKFF